MISVLLNEEISSYIVLHLLVFDSCVSAVGCGIAVQTGRSRFRIPNMLLEALIDIISFRPNYRPEVDSVSNRNEYQEYFLGVEAASA
jgi:hypothetical protein